VGWHVRTYLPAVLVLLMTISRFGVVDDNKPNVLVTSCNASSVGGEGCGEAYV
jgi:hypothetical protein